MREGVAGTASGKRTRICACHPAQGGEALSAGRFGCGLEEAWTPGSGGGECRCMPFVLVLVRAEQRERGGFTYASKDAREHDDRLLLTRCPEIRHHRRVETRGDLRRHFDNAKARPQHRRPSSPPKLSVSLGGGRRGSVASEKLGQRLGEGVHNMRKLPNILRNRY